MNDSGTNVRVDLRASRLAEDARLISQGQRYFLALINPPPVRSILTVTDASGIRSFHVESVVERTGDEGSGRGCLGQFVAEFRGQTVGSEHLRAMVTAELGTPSPVEFADSEPIDLAADRSDRAPSDPDPPAPSSPESNEAGRGKRRKARSRG